MRMTIHNARTSKKFGAFTPKHNDRNFNIKNAEHIDPERTKGNIYWNRSENRDNLRTMNGKLNKLSTLTC